jgi:hypothetical protein
MEIIKKKVHMIMTTGVTACTGTAGSCIVIIPDTGVTYNFKINLTGIHKDMGFFDASPDAETQSGVGSINIVRGTSSSRLSELKKYAVNVPFNQQYIGDGSYSVDGVDFLNSVSGVSVTYYIGGIKYVDNTDVTGTTTTFVFITSGTNSLNFINGAYYKDPKKENIISNPKIDDDVFIIRQELSAFEKNYRLEYVKNLAELQSYAGGNYFKIANNT